MKLFEHLRRETSNRLLDVVVGIAISAGEFCLFDILISFGSLFYLVEVKCLIRLFFEGRGLKSSFSVSCKNGEIKNSMHCFFTFCQIFFFFFVFTHLIILLT